MTAPGQDTPNTNQDAPPSQEYESLRARMNAYEMWEALSAEEKLSAILDTFPVEGWFRGDALPVPRAVSTHTPWHVGRNQGPVQKHWRQ